jgi:hypothetical protein
MCLYLTKRNATYYFRRAIPDELQQAFGGRTEFTFSLRTKDKEEAKRRRSVEALRTDRELEEARASLSPSHAPTAPHAPAPFRSQEEQERADAVQREDAERDARYAAREPAPRASLTEGGHGGTLRIMIVRLDSLKQTPISGRAVASAYG